MICLIQVLIRVITFIFQSDAVGYQYVLVLVNEHAPCNVHAKVIIYVAPSMAVQFFKCSFIVGASVYKVPFYANI